MRAMKQPSGAHRPSDPELLAAVAAGELGALGVLFDRYHEDVRQFLLRTAHAADVDDLVQETFLTTARAAGSYDGRDLARPFLIGVAAQLLRRRRRTLARLRNLLTTFGEAPQSPAPDPADALLAAESDAAVRAAVERLPEDQRIALVMVEWNGMSGVEAARALGVPPGTLWRWLHDARAEVRRRLSRGKP
jgi:RNA polymerase sigma-70 factor (ECF subfamily)